MIVIRINREIYFEREFITKFSTYAQKFDVKKMIMLYVDWMEANNLPVTTLTFEHPVYLNEGVFEPIGLEDSPFCTYNKVYALTKMDGEQLADVLYRGEEDTKIYRYKKYLIEPNFDRGWSYRNDRYYNSNPIFRIRNLNDIINL